jgi:putative serine protease PepD
VPDHDDEDGSASGPPPDPLDRLWLHPSELRSLFAESTSPARTRHRRLIGVVGLAAAGALLAAVGLVVVSGVLDTGDDTAVTSGVDAIGGAANTPLVAIAGASLVNVQVAKTDGTLSVSGVCIDNDVVLTSSHALDGATGVTVVAPDGASLPAVIGGADPETDLALLRVDDLPVSAARQGSSAELRTGDEVLAVATGTRSNPYWVSSGEVTALDQYVTTAAGTVIVGLFDTGTNAARRHSGGAVLDDHGLLVGILTTPAAGPPSGLAIPIDTARDVAGQLTLSGTAAHAWLGVSGTDDTESAGGGALVEQVIPDSPADKAGVAPGDVIVAVVDGESTTSVSGMAELMDEVRSRRPGNSLEINVLREGAKRQMAVSLTEKSSAYDGDSITPTTTTSP